MPHYPDDIEARLAAAENDTERVALLNGMVNDLFRADPRLTMKLAGEALRLSETINDPRSQAESLWSLAVSCETLSEYDEAKGYAGRSLALYRKLGDRREMAYLELTVGVLSMRVSHYAEALESFRNALELFHSLNRQQGAAQALNNIAAVYEATGDFPAALDAFLESLRINESFGNDRGIALVSGNIGNIYSHLGDADRAFEYNARALDVSRAIGEAYGIAISLGNIAPLYQARGDHDGALGALNESLQLFQEIGERRSEADTLIMLGRFHGDGGESKIALAYLKQASGIAATIGSGDLLAGAHLRTGEIHLAKRSHRSAITALRKGIAAADPSNLPLQTDLYRSLALALNGAGEEAEAFLHMREHARLQSELFGQERQRAVAEAQARFDLERAEREREIFRLRSEHLETMMEARAKELTSLAMHLVQKNAFLDRLRKDAVQFASEQPAARSALSALMKAISFNLQGDDDWKRFETEFQHVHHDFIQTLAQRYPGLTPAELKVCALLKVNLSNKEIANLLSVGLRNVETHRYSIRKKLNLPTEANLSLFLTGI